MSGTITNDARKKYIDAIKGFCIVLVLFSHAGGIPYIGRVLFACYMQVYFVIAGITYNDRKNETLSRFIRKKAKRLLIPYAIYGTALWIADCIYERLTFSEIFRGGTELYMQGTVFFPIMDIRTMSFCLTT